HDREFLDNVVTSTLGFEGNGKLADYVGGYQDWQRQGGKWADTSRAAKPQKSLEKSAAVAPPAKTAESPAKKPASKLSYKLQRELDALPGQIEQWEAELLELSNQMAQPEFYNRSPEAIAAASQVIADKEAALQVAYQRWDELENLKGE
ncbi:MAG TPA: ABC transporter ATP-binding protein, partial [Cellvibrionaceae bacterium]|nr:ABC transporter ATP-binding protein [Cellvibrionaceae bacterium]